MKKTSRILTTLAALALATAAVAQTAPTPSAATSPEEPVKLEAFTVTGSNIKRIDVEKTLPVTVLDTSAIDIRDASQAADLLLASLADTTLDALLARFEK